MNVIKEIEQINKAELANGTVNTPASWHTKYADSAWVYVGNLPLQLSEGDIIAVMSQVSFCLASICSFEHDAD